MFLTKLELFDDGFLSKQLMFGSGSELKSGQIRSRLDFFTPKMQVRFKNKILDLSF